MVPRDGGKVNGFGCPNDPGCEHPSFVHDVYDYDDPYPTCCAEGCRCGHPGDAEAPHG